jgi:hypothetical protein
MCPLCYINAILLAILGSSAIALIQHPVTITIGVILTIAAFYYFYKGYKKNQGKGGLQKNLTTTFLVISSFLFGYLVAAYQTHDYFEQKYSTTESKDNDTADQTN